MNPYDPPQHRTPWSCNLLEDFSGNVPISPVTLPENPPAGSPVAKHGRLQVRGNQVVNEAGEPVRLRGMSFFWSQWMGHYWNEDVVKWLKKDWKVTLIRAAMGVEMGGHLENPGPETKKMQAVVDAAIKIGIYVIIDWHDHNAEQHKHQAMSFFDAMARTYGKYPNVLFETFNEPVHQNWWGVIKPYHEQMVRVIRKHSDNIVICGTPKWSSDVAVASTAPVPGENIAYTIHFYAATHHESLRNNVRTALNNGVAVFATEWGTCEASGNGGLNLGETRAWLAFFEEHHISDANWAISDKSESCSALRAGAPPRGNWQLGQLTDSGRFVRDSLQQHQLSGRCSAPHQNCRPTGCCSSPGWQCFEKNAEWAACKPSCTPGIDANDHPDWKTPWTCKVIDRSSDATSPSPEPTPVAPDRQPNSPSAAPPGSPVAEHGALSVRGNQVIGEHGQRVRLRGMSMFWSQWMGKYWNKDVIEWLHKDWKISLVRAAFGIEMGGYLENSGAELQKLYEIVETAIKVGVYVIIDWHDHNAHAHVAQAKTFFDDMARKYGKHPNVLFETFNEPVHQNWPEVKQYHNQVVNVIRKHTDNLVICGTPKWSQDVDIASVDRVQGKNIAYTIHFYASSHGEWLRGKVRKALDNGVAIFATEWGTCEASGNGQLRLDEARAWLAFFEYHGISDANWAISDKKESCSALSPGASSSGHWQSSDLTESGRFVRESIRNHGHKGKCSVPHENCRATRCCSKPGWKCYEKNKEWASCRPSCTPGVDPNDHPQYLTPWTCKVLDTTPAVDPTPAPAPEPTIPVEDPPPGSPVAMYGQLQVKGNKIVGKMGTPVRLRGMSLFWSQWMGHYWNEDVMEWMRKDWKVTLVRAAMGVEMGGHLENPGKEAAKLHAVVKACIKLGIYVIIDWHDHKATEHKDEAREFFREMAQTYGKHPNVLFETFNEPVHQSWSGEVKPYHEEMVNVIRQHTDNLIICGTPKWSQDVDVASTDKVKGKNIAYTIHFYASSHGEELRSKCRTALNNGAAIFATEWGTCEASGNGRLHLAEARAWLAFFEEHSISDANWAISDKDESCSALQPHASPTGGWQQNQLTESGRFVRDSLHTHHRSQVANACSAPNEDCRFSGCCSVPGHTCFQKNAEWATCRKSCSPNHPQHLTPWTCNTIVSHRSGIVVLIEPKTGDAVKGVGQEQPWALGMHRSLAIVALVGFTLPLLLLISKLVKMWRRSREGWTAVANPDQLMPLDNSETA